MNSPEEIKGEKHFKQYDDDWALRCVTEGRVEELKERYDTAKSWGHTLKWRGSVADAIIDANPDKSVFVINNLEMFDADPNQIGEKILSSNTHYMNILVDNLNKFPKLDHNQIAQRLLASGYAKLMGHIFAKLKLDDAKKAEVDAFLNS